MQSPADGSPGSADGVPDIVTEQLGGREQDAAPIGLMGLCDLRSRIDTGLMGQIKTGLMRQSDNGLSGQAIVSVFGRKRIVKGRTLSSPDESVNLAMKIGHLYWLKSGPAQLDNPPS